MNGTTTVMGERGTNASAGADGVTAPPSVGTQRGESRNAAEEWAATVAWHTQASRARFRGVTALASSAGETGESRNRRHEAHRTGRSCGVCEAVLLWEPTVGAKLIAGYGHGFGARLTPVPVCGACADPEARATAEQHARVWRRPCRGCTTPLLFLVVRCYGGDWCSIRCRYEHYGWYSSRHQEALLARRGKTCPVCGEVFDGTRRDQVTCSPACRQKAYRQRRLHSDVNGDSGEASGLNAMAFKRGAG